MKTERAERFLHALADILEGFPAVLTWGILVVQILALLLWFGAVKPRFLSRRPGIPLAVIYAISPFYLLVLADALYQTLWPRGLEQLGDIPHLSYVLGSLFIALIPMSFAIWLATEKNPPKRFIPKWLRRVESPPTGEHGIR